MIGGILFLSCLFVCLFVCLSVVNFNLRYNFWTVRHRDFIFGMHTPLMTNDTLSNDIKINDLVTLTLTLKLTIAFWTLLLPGQGHSVSQTLLDFFYKSKMPRNPHKLNGIHLSIESHFVGVHGRYELHRKEEQIKCTALQQSLSRYCLL